MTLEQLKREVNNLSALELKELADHIIKEADRRLTHSMILSKSLGARIGKKTSKPKH